MPRSLLIVAALLLVSACESRRAAPSAASSSAPVSSVAQPIVVDVYTEPVCPWCFIGTERLDRAIASSDVGARVELRHHALLLQPDTPAEGTDIAAYLRSITGYDPGEMFRRVEAVGVCNLDGECS